MEAALREADRRKDEFLAMLGHELRNPLAPIRNALHILRLRPAGDPAVAAGAGDDRAPGGPALVRLVDDLLDVSRISQRQDRPPQGAGRSVGAHGPRDGGNAPGRARNSEHRLEVATARRPLPVEADPARLEQVFVEPAEQRRQVHPAGRPHPAGVAERGRTRRCCRVRRQRHRHPRRACCRGSSTCSRRPSASLDRVSRAGWASA